MKKLLAAVLAPGLVALMISAASAAPITPHFNDYPGYSPTQDDLDAAASAWFNTNYGITFDHMYMYTDSRDTFDGLGISNGWVSENYLPNTTGYVFFTDTTNFVGLDWFTILNETVTFSVFNSANTLLDSFTVSTPGSGSNTLNGTGISYLTLNATGGFAAISTLSYDYDGVTDGVNNDTTQVPEPSTLLLLGSGLTGLGLASWRKWTNRA